ncbi:MAG: SEL1-like repeat protein [Salinarimonas sp.]|nr:SEL1-like repeat protein [Salinarimonas sp.]
MGMVLWKRRYAVGKYAGVLFGLSLAVMLGWTEALAQASSSITVFGRTVTVTGGGSQNIRSGLAGGTTIIVDGTAIEVGRETITLLDEVYEIGPDGPIHIRIEGDDILLEVDGAPVASIRDASRSERRLAGLLAEAEAGDAVAQMRLGLRYRHGEGVDQDFEEAMRWLRKSAEQGNDIGQTNLAIMLYRGEGADRNFEEAREWYEKAAAQGEAVAQGNLGAMLINGEGGPVDLDRAEELLRLAADGGEEIAAFNLYLILRPQGLVGTDTQAALRYLRLSAEREYLPAIHRLAGLYSRGNLVEADHAQAEIYYRRAVERDHLPAMFELADLLLNQGESTPERLEEGLALLHAAVERGEVRAINDLGSYKFEGNFVEQDEAAGVALFRRAAEADHAIAKRNLAIAYEHGRGVERDLEQARRWYQSAADAGHQRAPDDLERIRAALAEAEAAIYWYARGGEQVGPVPLSELQALADRREVGPSTLIWKSGLADWIAAGGYAGIAIP